MIAWKAVPVAALCVSCLGIPAAVLAQSASTDDASDMSAIFDASLEQLEQIIVTAQKREQPIQDVPISVTAISGAKISGASIQNLQELSPYLPGVTINQAVIDNNLFIRGIGSGVNLGFERSVGTYIDGVYIGRGQLARSPFLDLERVEVLRGPQGILFGKNTIAGALNIITKPAAPAFEGSLAAHVDPRYGDQIITGVIAGELSPSFSARVTASVRHLDGYFDHLIVDEELVEKDHKLFRGQLRWEPTDQLNATLKLNHAKFDEDGRERVLRHADVGTAFHDIVSEDRPVGGFRPGAEEFNNTRSNIAALTVNLTQGEHQFTSISAYLGYEAEILTDLLILPFFPEPAQPADAVVTSDEEYRQLSQEFRVLSPQDQPLTYLVGVYAQRSHLDIDRDVSGTFLADTRRQTNQKGTSTSLFAEATRQLSSNWDVTIGARVDRESKEFKRIQQRLESAEFVDSIAPFTLDRKETKVTGAATLRYTISDQWMSYLKFTTGFKGGGFDESVTRGLAPGETLNGLFEFEEETVRAWEIGGKFKFLQGAAELNVAAFRSTYEDLQTSVFDSVSAFRVANAGSSISQGVEIGGRWRVSPRLLINGTFAYLDAYFDDFSDGPCSQWHAQNTSTCIGPVRDLSNEPLPFAPDTAATAGFEYSVSISPRLLLQIDMDVLYSDSYQTAADLDPLTGQDAYTRLDLRIGIGPSSANWELAVVGKNLTDEVVYGWTNDVLASNVPQRRNTYNALREAPRTVALQARVHFK